MFIKIIFAFAVLLALCYKSEAAVAGALPNPNHPGKCWIGGEEFDVGTHHPKGKCMEIHCATDFSAQLYTCGVAIGADGKRKYDEDLTKEYPACCP